MRYAELEELLLNHLNPHKWKRTLELIDDIAKERRRKGKKSFWHHVLGFFSTTLDDILWEPSIGKMHVLLSQFEEEGKVESRWRDDPPEVLARRGGNRAREYRLTEFGRRYRSLEQSSRQYQEKLQKIRTRHAAAYAAAFHLCTA